MRPTRWFLPVSIVTLLACTPDFRGDGPPEPTENGSTEADPSRGRATLDDDYSDHSGTDVGMETDQGTLAGPSSDAPSSLGELSVRSAVAPTAACPTDAPISQGFTSGHDGVDLANKRGTPIFAVSDGVVTDSGPAQGYGQWIRIRHDDGSMTESGHMFQRDVKVGDRVTAGQRIALMGSEGQSTGPHLHLRTYASAGKTGSGSGMNPVEYLRARGVSLPCKAGGVTSPPPEGTFNVSVWKTTQIRDAERSDAAVVGQATSNTSYVATCFKRGELRVAEGFENDHWVKIRSGSVVGFVNGIYLRGDETGGVTKACE